MFCWWASRILLRFAVEDFSIFWMVSISCWLGFDSFCRVVWFRLFCFRILEALKIRMAARKAAIVPASVRPLLDRNRATVPQVAIGCQYWAIAFAICKSCSSVAETLSGKVRRLSMTLSCLGSVVYGEH